MKDELDEKDISTRELVRSRQPNSKDTDEKQPSGNEDPEVIADYNHQLREWNEEREKEKQQSYSGPSSLQDAWDPIKRDFFNRIEMIHPLFFLASLLCLVPEYYVWKVHFEQWQQIENFEPSFTTLNALLAFGTVAGMALSWHAVIACWQNKRRTNRIDGGLRAVTVMAIVFFACLFAFESMSFYEYMRSPKTDAFGNVIPGKSHREALIKIGSWGSLNFIFGFITGFCTSHITRKE